METGEIVYLHEDVERFEIENEKHSCHTRLCLCTGECCFGFQRKLVQKLVDTHPNLVCGEGRATQEEIEETFSRFDEDKSAYLDKLELRGVGIQAWGFSRSEMDQVYAYFPTKLDDRVDFEEFEWLVRRYDHLFELQAKRFVEEHAETLEGEAWGGCCCCLCTLGLSFCPLYRKVRSYVPMSHP